ncbi:hypothetical protein HOY82DRAFT_537664 [Tuber indicum]|nr:hypothetical protein HOY82DRAFT_537664 [Tuber indicum]
MSRNHINVGYKYNNLLKSYRAAVKLNNQTGWGLTEEDLSIGQRSLREKIFRDRPNIQPPAFYDSGADASAVNTTNAVERLLGAMISVDKEDNLEGQEERDLAFDLDREDYGEEGLRIGERDNQEGLEEEICWGDEESDDVAEREGSIQRDGR